MDVYLLGAGFSSDAGLPTMKNFISGLEKAGQSDSMPAARGVISRALKFAYGLGESNIETLLTKALNEPVFFDLIWAFGLTINLLSLRFIESCRGKGDVGWYADFARLLCTDRCHVLTFNYDMIVEELLWHSVGCREDYGLLFDEEQNSTGSGKNGSAVPLFKLHGSVSWLWCMNCRYTVNRNRHILDSVYYRESPCPRCSFKLVPLMIPPTFHKAVEFGPVLLGMWAEADRLFETASRFIIGGLSFAQPDSDFRERFLAGVKKNRVAKEVIIVNRDRETSRAIGNLLPRGLPWRIVPGFPRYCHEAKIKKQQRT